MPIVVCSIHVCDLSFEPLVDHEANDGDSDTTRRRSKRKPSSAELQSPPPSTTRIDCIKGCGKDYKSSSRAKAAHEFFCKGPKSLHFVSNDAAPVSQPAKLHCKHGCGKSYAIKNSRGVAAHEVKCAMNPAQSTPSRQHSVAGVRGARGDAGPAELLALVALRAHQQSQAEQEF